MQCGLFRERACLCKRHGCCDLLIHLMFELFEIRIGSKAVVAHRSLEQRERITRAMFLDFFFGAVMAACEGSAIE